VAVFDARPFGDGASARNGGQVLTGLELGAGELLAQFGPHRARALFAASLDAIAALEQLVSDEGIDCDCARVGHLEAAAKPSHFEHFKTERDVLAREFGHRVDLLPRALQDAELGTEQYHGLLVDERSVALHPVKYLQGLARAAVTAGADLFDRTPVERVTRVGAGFRVRAGGRDIDVRDIVACTNGYTDRALPALRRRVVPIGSYAIATAPLPEDLAREILPRRRLVFDSKYFLSSFRLSPDNRLVFGGRAQFTTASPDSTRQSTDMLRQGMVGVFPQLRDVPVEYAWSGNVDFTRDRLPHAGLLDGMHYAIGYGGHGVALATYLGGRVAECVLGRPGDTPFHDLPFPAIPLYRGRPWFLPLAGLYYKWKDWRS
jgi:glycine/D-amino acid oxidase-like deaminating enzyme